MSGYTERRAEAIHVADFLNYGQENAVTQRELTAALHLSGRTIRHMIETERRAGAPICSDNQRGYYLAADEKELARFVQSMRRRAGEILQTAAAVEGATS